MRKDSFVSNLQQAMNIEKQAVDSHMKNLKMIEPVIQAFDGKVINKRLIDALKEETGEYIHHTKVSYGEFFDMTYNGSIEQNYHRWTHATFHRSLKVKLSKMPEDDRRLDAAKTMKTVEEVIAKLENWSAAYTFDRELAQQRMDRLIQIESMIDDLFNESDMVTKEALRNTSSKIR